MAYREFRPRAELTNLVACTWERQVSPSDASRTGRVLPDGCVDLIWRDDELLVAGPDRGPVVTPLPSGQTIVGLRLRPGTAGWALGLPARELRDERLRLEEVCGRPGSELTERVAEAADKRSVLEDFVLRRLPSAGDLDPLVLAATGQLGLPGSRVGSLSSALGTSERQLLRRFDAAVGYGPKTLDRILRFRRFLARAPVSGNDDLARIAADLGYADQAHMTRECVRLSGLSPGRLVAAWAG